MFIYLKLDVLDEIKKAFRRLARQYHPDKVMIDTMYVYTCMSVDLTNIYIL